MSKNTNGNHGVSEDIFLAVALFQCPFCQEMATFGYLDSGDHVVVHTPDCLTFMTLDLVEYLAAVSVEMRRTGLH